MSEWKKLSKSELQTIAPIRADGQPDTYNFVPTRFITKEEAEARGWTHFYLGDVCSYGHKAPRFVSNPRHCVDCKRLREGRLTIGGRGEAEYKRSRKYAQRVPSGSADATVVTVAAAPEPTSLEKKFLTAYANTKDFEQAAHELRQTPGFFQARLSFSKPFREAVEFLEEQFGLSHTPSVTDEFEWTEEKRAVLIKTYVNTASLAKAQAAIGCTHWDYEREKEDNPAFAEMIAQNEPYAKRALGNILLDKGLNGDGRILPKVAAANLPEYADRMNINMNVTEKMNGEQLKQQFALLAEQLGLERSGRIALDAEFYEVKSAGAIESRPADAVDVRPPSSEPNRDLL